MPEAADDPFALGTLTRFYRFHARIYDATRPWLLRGRREIVRGLEVEAGQRVLDVGCGTGNNLLRLAASGADVVGFEPSEPMRVRAERRIRERTEPIRIDPRPYRRGVVAAGSVDRLLFSYSLSMIPPWAEVLAAAREDLRGTGRIGVVDFLDAREPLTHAALSASHVALGPERLAGLKALFPRHRVEIRNGLTWRYFLFWGEVA